MAVVELNEQNFRETVENNATVIIDFWAPWCGPCRSFAPTFEAASDQHGDIVFAKVNTEEQRSIAAGFRIRSIPTLMVFRDQIIIYSEAGALAASQLDGLIAQVRALDMDAVRAEMAKEKVSEA